MRTKRTRKRGRTTSPPRKGRSATEPHGSLIRLLPEYEERYIILHRHTFPGVLRRIRQCNIRNYSIFLHEGMLFSHFEYTGKDFRSDIAAMADEVTKEWWKLTAPMQEPLEGRADGEHWASMECVLFLRKGDQVKGRVRRLAGMARFPLAAGSGEQIQERIAEIEGNFRHQPMTALALYRWKERVFCYCEVRGKAELGDLFQEMQEVFHTP